ncbi:ligand-binding sensor domain-containing protein/signal transduction histidine kinase/CheY-like chemotaxis protein [Pedobacter sp. AK017]|uniref:hybrid sensor histidine kinase/response regulator transcription factor n=1 Tax=Pedobacter sp. AK017 TaxID=2723073 RepID=UPI00161F0424|nr:two-component regulator propeller domain-containing protein [Pedobacter sp. AK017]MBB5438384.1 ligand-binding sensor domain-containing protein/signal transduction histidine kinase/CheY-like chemotaxis protein [Pedobacter sp. AK017]
MRRYLTRELLTKWMVFMLFLLLGNTAFAQLSFDHLSVGNGLSQSTVLSICKDSRGYMWFGTRDCLNRYDGKGVKIYRTDPDDPATISAEDYIYALLEDRQKNLWIGTQNGLNRYIPEKDAFERIAYEPKNPNSISDKIVLSILADSRGQVWFGTNKGLSMLENPASRKFKKFYQKDGIAGNSVYTVFEDSKRNIWVGTTEGLTMMTLKNGRYTFTSFRHDPADPNSISGSSVKAIAEDKQGRIWIGSETEGLNLYVPVSGSFVHFKYNPLIADGLSNNIIRKIMVAKNGSLWIATMNGLNILDPQTFRFTAYKHDSDSRKSLSDNSIKEIYEDEQGSVWVGTMFGGVNVTHHNTIPFTVYKYNKYRNSISSDIISVIEADAQGNLWIGTEGQGLNYLDLKTGLFKKYINDPGDPGSLSNNTIKAIFKDSKGRVWIGLYQGGLELFMPASGKFKHYPHDPRYANSLSFGYVSSIAEDEHGRLLVGTSSKGLNIFDPEQGVLSLLSDLPTKGLKLSSSYIRFAYQDSKKNVWVGTPRGLNLLTPGAAQFKVFFRGSHTDSLKSNQISCIREDHRGNIWIGSLRGGLSLYHPESRSFTTYSRANGMASDNIIDILEDNERNLWISTDRGLTKFDVRRKTFKNYNTGDGLPTNEFNINSAYKDKSGKLYFGSYNGLVTFTPRDIKENTALPKAVFSGLRLFNKPVAINGPDKLLKEDISFTKQITFSADQNIFTIDFLALNYIQPQRNKYAYKLEGFEKDWNYVNIPSATYTNLPSGKYKLLVKGSNNDGLWNNTPTAMEIRILPPLWQTWWAYLLYFIAGSALLYFVLRFTRRQQKLESELYYEHLNNERQQELYQMKLDFFTRISHEIRTPLTLIFAPLEKLIQLTKENDTVNQQLLGIKRNTDRLLRLISELLDFRKIESGNASLQVSENDLVAFCRNIYNAYQSLAEVKNITYSFYSPEERIPAYYDISQLEKVFFNILSNAFKYTPDGGKISFNLTKENDRVKVEITDTGIGIPVDAQAKIFTNFYQVKSGTIAAEGWGIGLALVKNIVDLHKGELTVFSEPAAEGKPGKTSLTVTLSLGKAHFKAEELTDTPLLMKTVTDVPVTEGPVPMEEGGLEVLAEKKYTVQVVEDNDELRGFIVQSLQNTYHILESINGLQGWETAIENVPDIIVSDVTMPELNGLELCLKLKQEEKTNHIPVIMLTAMASHLHQVDGLEAGADVYITKPFSIQVLELSIRNLLQGREGLKQKYMKQIMLSPRKLEIESPDEKFLNKLMQLVEDKMEDPDFNVGSLVEDIGMSQTVLYKKIKALTGLSITDFIKSQRLKRAAQLLSDHQLNIAEVAYSVGFNDRKYFSKEFRKQFGVAPSDYHGKTD